MVIRSFKKWLGYHPRRVMVGFQSYDMMLELKFCVPARDPYISMRLHMFPEMIKFKQEILDTIQQAVKEVAYVRKVKR